MMKGGWAMCTCAGCGLPSLVRLFSQYRGLLAVIQDSSGIHAWLCDHLVAWLFEKSTGEEDK